MACGSSRSPRVTRRFAAVRGGGGPRAPLVRRGSALAHHPRPSLSAPPLLSFLPPARPPRPYTQWLSLGGCSPSCTLQRSQCGPRRTRCGAGSGGASPLWSHPFPWPRLPRARFLLNRIPLFISTGHHFYSGNGQSGATLATSWPSLFPRAMRSRSHTLYDPSNIHRVPVAPKRRNTGRRLPCGGTCGEGGGGKRDAGARGLCDEGLESAGQTAVVGRQCGAVGLCLCTMHRASTFSAFLACVAIRGARHKTV